MAAPKQTTAVAKKNKPKFTVRVKTFFRSVWAELKKSTLAYQKTDDYLHWCGAGNHFCDRARAVDCGFHPDFGFGRSYELI